MFINKSYISYSISSQHITILKDDEQYSQRSCNLSVIVNGMRV